MAILDSLMQPIPEEKNHFVVYYDLLDSDDAGREPNDPLFCRSAKSSLYVIAKNRDKVRYC